MCESDTLLSGEIMPTSALYNLCLDGASVCMCVCVCVCVCVNTCMLCVQTQLGIQYRVCTDNTDICLTGKPFTGRHYTQHD